MLSTSRRRWAVTSAIAVATRTTATARAAIAVTRKRTVVPGGAGDQSASAVIR